MVFYNSWEEIDYTPDGVDSHAGQRMDWFQGSKKWGATGRPVLVIPSLSSFYLAPRTSQYRQLMTTTLARMAYRWLHVVGGDVLVPRLTVARGGATGNNVSDASYDPDSQLFGPAYAGNGVFIPPGENPGGASVEPWRDPLRHMPEKDMWYVRYYIAQHAKERGWDNGRVGCAASSAGAVCAGFAIYGQDQTTALGLTGVRNTDMVWGMAHLSQMPTRFRTMEQQAELGYMFPDMALGGNYDVPAEFLEDASADYQDALSFLTFDTGDATPLYLASEAASEGANRDPPYSDDLVTDFHSLDFGAMAGRTRNLYRFVAYSDAVATTGDEDAVYADADNDDNSPYIINAVDSFVSAMDVETPNVTDFTLMGVMPSYNTVTAQAGSSLASADFTQLVAAGTHKWALIENVTHGSATAVLRFMVGVTDSQLGHYLHSPNASALNYLSSSWRLVPTAGQAIYGKPQSTGTPVNYQITLFG